MPSHSQSLSDFSRAMDLTMSPEENELRTRILLLRELGWSRDQIAIEVGRNKQWIGNILMAWKATEGLRKNW